MVANVQSKKALKDLGNGKAPFLQQKEKQKTPPPAAFSEPSLEEVIKQVINHHIGTGFVM